MVSILLLVGKDSQQGKADARLAAGLQTAVTIYDERIADAATHARQLAASPELAVALRSGDATALRAVTDQTANEPGVVRVEVLDNAGREMAATGPASAVAFARLGLTELARPVGALRLSTTTAQQYAAEVHRLTGREVVLRRGGATLASTVAPPSTTLGPDQTADLSAGGESYTGRMRPPSMPATG